MKKIIAVAVLSFVFLPMTSWALTPMEYFNSLVAGETTTGYQDGLFYEAEFNQPTALALDASGDRLFVADSGNNRIRVIFLNEQNRVETFAGNGKALCADGPLMEASFNQPTQLAMLPDDRLAVCENGDSRVRVIDLKTKTVSTVGKGGYGLVWSMVYEPKNKSLYLSAPIDGVLHQLNLETQDESVVLSQNSKIPNPGALYADEAHLYAADLKLPEIYQVDKAEKTPVQLSLLGKGKEVIALTQSEGIFYALQLGDESLVRITPNYAPVSLASNWGFTLENNRGYFPLLQFQRTEIAGFIASPEARKFYICQQQGNSIISVKDYQFDALAAARSVNQDLLTDYNYPAAKPKKTFRILIYGDSRIVTSPQMFQSTVKKEAIPESNFEGMRVNTLSKQLEFNLNAQAALKGVDEHFEVLTEGKPGAHAPMSVYYDVPAVAKKYDVDLVILLFAASDQTGFEDYYEKKLGPDGVPDQGIDTEYILKPWKERIPAGAPKRFLDECLKEKYATAASKTSLSFASFFVMIHAGDPEILNNLREMMSLPIKLLVRKLNGIKNSSGTPPQFLFCLVPTPGAQFIKDNQVFWKQICSDSQTSMLDLTNEFHALETGFFPVYQDCCSRHFSAYGNDLIAYLLSNALPDQNWIPFKPAESKK